MHPRVVRHLARRPAAGRDRRERGRAAAGGNYSRAWLPAPDVRIELSDGGTLTGAYAYVNRHGVLHNGSGTPRAHPGQRQLLTGLLAGSAPLRELFGVTPEDFCARARGDAALCRRGIRLFAEHKWMTASGLEGYVRPEQG